MSIIFDKLSGSNFYNNIIKILEKLTDIKWGFVSARRRVQYLSSIELPIKIGVLWGRNYEKNCKWVLDIEIINKYPRLFESQTIWTDAVAVELQSKLLAVLARSTLGSAISIIITIKQWRPSHEYLTLLLYAKEQNKLHKLDNIKEYDTYLESCYNLTI